MEATESTNESNESNESNETSLRAQLRAELAATAADLRLLKRWWRSPPDDRPPPPATSSGLASVRDAKLRATLLHLALAHSRRRLHLRTWRGEEVATLAAQAQRLTDELARLGKLLVSTPALDEPWRRRLEVMLAQVA
jgi:hypothetical protein